MTTKKLMQAAAGNAGGDKVYVEDVFSTYLLNGTEAESGSSVTAINNGIDLSGEGGLVWIKRRDDAAYHRLFDTVRGNTKFVQSNSSAAESDLSYWDTVNVNGFNNNGFDFIGQSTTGITFASWTFRKQKGFFDVKEVTKSSGSNLVVDFSDLGSIGFVAAKYLGAQDWICWSKGMTSTHHLKFNQNDASSSGNYMTVSGTSVTLIDGAFSSGDSVIYAWADGADSSAQIFGDGGDEAIIKSGLFEAAANTTVDLGFEPQWIMFKNTTSAGNWQIVDNMRGMPSTQDDRQLMANNTNHESDNGLTTITATGFTWLPSAASNDYIYMAIRRGPMKEPDAGTDVFNGVLTYSDSSTTTGFPVDIGLPVDLGFIAYTTTGTQITMNRLMGLTKNPQPGSGSLSTYNNTAQANSGELWGADNSTGFRIYGHSYQRICYGWRRYPKVFDMVVYNGNATAPMDVKHNLGVAAELLIFKKVTAAENWNVLNTHVTDGYNNTGRMFLDTDAAYASTGWGGTLSSATAITVNTSYFLNETGSTYIAFLFATLAGVSKVGTYSGTTNDIDVDCGFSSGARFVMIKRADSTGNWYYWDTMRGIAAGNDPYLRFDEGAAQVSSTDYIDPLASGFRVTSGAGSVAGLNASGGTYLFLAFA